MPFGDVSLQKSEGRIWKKAKGMFPGEGWGGVDLRGSERSLVWISMWKVGKNGEFDRKELGLRVGKP